MRCGAAISYPWKSIKLKVKVHLRRLYLAQLMTLATQEMGASGFGTVRMKIPESAKLKSKRKNRLVSLWIP